MLEIIWALARFTAIIAIIYLVFSWIVKRIEKKNTKERRERRNRQRLGGDITGTERSIEMIESRGSESRASNRSDRLV